MKDRQKMIEAMAEAICKGLGWQWPPIESDTVPSQRELLYASRLALSAIEAAGYVLVPREPTDEMRNAIDRSIMEQGSFGFDARKVYAAAISASPMGENEASND